MGLGNPLCRKEKWQEQNLIAICANYWHWSVTLELWYYINTLRACAKDKAIVFVCHRLSYAAAQKSPDLKI